MNFTFSNKIKVYAHKVNHSKITFELFLIGVLWALFFCIRHDMSIQSLKVTTFYIAVMVAALGPFFYFHPKIIGGAVTIAVLTWLFH